MNTLDRVTQYLAALEKRLRWLAFTRGAAVTAATALVLTLLAVLALLLLGGTLYHIAGIARSCAANSARSSGA